MSVVAWLKFRKPMSKYPETPQQRKVKIGGAMIREKCSGKKGKDFFQCRSIILKCAFHDEKCEEELLELKRRVKEELKA